MPGKDGGELAKELRRMPQFASTPVLFVTSLYSGAKAGVVSGWQFLSKPVDPQRLVSTVRELLPAKAA
jgi:two-component system chemotaxis response regulator CheY